MSTTGSLTAIRRVRWVVPVLGLAVAGAVGWWIDRGLHERLRAGIEADLQASVRSAAAAVDTWMDGHVRAARAVATDATIAPVLVAATGREVRGATGEELRVSDPILALGSVLEQRLETTGFRAFVLAGPDGRCLAASDDELLGEPVPAANAHHVLAGVNAMGSWFRRPAPGDHVRGGLMRHGLMYVGEPVRDEKGEVVAALLLAVEADVTLAPLLAAGQEGRSGETYAFDGSGLVLTPRRSGTPQINLDELPKAGEDTPRAGVDAVGYTHAGSEPVVGAWIWHELAGIGIATEMARDEAYAATDVVHDGGWLLLALIGLLGSGVVISSRRNAVLQRRMRDAERTAKQLGQYTLVQKIGEGGMGEVYYARHAMLRRPCAIKLLHPDKATEHFVTRFEREVQNTSRLTHPNTIQVYDFGRTPGGTFYYAMEYLVGVSLDDFVREEGPLPEARVIYILLQVCASLNEAHGLGLVHRDIKPANVALCTAGAAYDVVKVLDFGLVMDRGAQSADISGAITGTPAYLSPEAITDPTEVDARSDLYAVGALGYFLLTGQRIFDTDSVIELINRQLKEKPLPPSERVDTPIQPDVEAALMACLEKNPAKRPKSANALARELEWCLAGSDWNRDKARHWWQENKSRMEQLYGLSTSAPKTPTDGTRTVAIDLNARTHD